MIITISATLNEEQIDILAKQKGYQEGSVTKEDFIRKVYESLIISDASLEFIRHSEFVKESQKQAEEKAIREQVAQSITSTIE